MSEKLFTASVLLALIASVKPEEQEKAVGDFLAEKALEDIAAEKAAHEATKNQSTEIITDLKSQLVETEQKAEEAGAEKTIKVGNDVYVMAIPSFRHGSTIYGYDALKSNPTLIKELIEIGSGVLVKKQKA